MLCIALPAHDRFDRVVRDHGAQTVGAKQYTITCVYVEFVDVGSHVYVGTNRAGDDRTIRVYARFFGGNLTSFDEVSHERVVTRDLL